MFKRAIWALAAVVCLLTPAAVRAQGDYLDVYIVKVKPEKLSEFQALTKKWVDANRRFNGDRWLTAETIYGEGGVYVFVSPRQDYAEIDKANAASMQSVSKAFGKEATEKLVRDFESCLEWSHSELRRRRPDLSSKAPADMDSFTKLVGESRVLRTIVVHVRPGHGADFEALLKETKESADKAANTQPVLVSQVIEGGKGATFYITTLRSSLGGFDKNPTLREILGEEGFKKFQQANAESVAGTESALYRFSPELSNPPEEIAKVAADFWRPKTVTASAMKPKAAAAKAPDAKPSAEKPKR